MVRFNEIGHQYESEDNIKWQSVTSIVKLFQPLFDADGQAKKSVKNKKSKWYGMDPEQVKQIWTGLGKTAVELGNWYHKEREKQICEINNIEHSGEECHIIHPIIKDSIKYAPEQKLENNHIYPEHFVYLKSAQICGQSDLVQIIKNKINIIDYKTNRELTTKGYTKWDGSVTRLLYPVNHLEDCKLTIYNLQLSLYLYIILKHNPDLKPGRLTINHIIFEEIDEDRLGTKSIKRDNNGDPIVKEIIKYDLPYLKEEIQIILNYLKELPNK